MYVVYHQIIALKPLGQKPKRHHSVWGSCKDYLKNDNARFVAEMSVEMKNKFTSSVI